MLSLLRNLPKIIFLLPATYMHELCHLIVALLCGHKILNFTVFPRMDENNNITLGSVTSYPLINITFLFVSLAPLLLLVVLWFLIDFSPFMGISFANERLSFFVDESILKSTEGLLTLFVSYQLFVGAKPSMTDIKVAFQSLLSPFGRGL